MMMMKRMLFSHLQKISFAWWWCPKYSSVLANSFLIDSSDDVHKTSILCPGKKMEFTNGILCKYFFIWPNNLIKSNVCGMCYEFFKCFFMKSTQIASNCLRKHIKICNYGIFMKIKCYIIYLIFSLCLFSFFFKI